MNSVQIETESIKLDQFLKWAGIAPTGGDAKYLITNNLVKVNNIVETKRGRVLKIGDIIEIEDAGLFRVESF